MEPNPYEAPREVGYSTPGKADDDDPLFVFATSVVVILAWLFVAVVAMLAIAAVASEQFL